MYSLETMRKAVMLMESQRWYEPPLDIDVSSDVEEESSIVMQDKLLLSLQVKLGWRATANRDQLPAAMERMARMAHNSMYGDVIARLSKLRYDSCFMQREDISNEILKIINEIRGE